VKHSPANTQTHRETYREWAPCTGLLHKQIVKHVP